MGSRLQAQELPPDTISLVFGRLSGQQGVGGGGAESWNSLYPPSAAAHGPQVSRTPQSVE